MQRGENEGEGCCLGIPPPVEGDTERGEAGNDEGVVECRKRCEVSRCADRVRQERQEQRLLVPGAYAVWLEWVLRDDEVVLVRDRADAADGQRNEKTDRNR